MNNNDDGPVRRRLDPEECAKRIAYATNQFEIHKMYAMYWQAMAMTGVAAARNREQGRVATEEERAQGLTMGWRKLSEEENTKDALDTMKRHIEHMGKCNDCISILRNGEEPGVHDVTLHGKCNDCISILRNGEEPGVHDVC